MKGFVVKLGSKKDIEDLWSIYQQTIHGSWTLQDFWKFSCEKGSFFDILERNERLVGFSMYSFLSPEIDLINIAVLSEYQRQGGATKLIQFLKEQYKNEKNTKIFLECRSESKAFLFYQAQGFVECGVRKNYYSNGEDAVRMYLPL